MRAMKVEITITPNEAEGESAGGGDILGDGTSAAAGETAARTRYICTCSSQGPTRDF